MRSRRNSARRSVRRGAAIAEAAIILTVFLMLIFGTIDMGLAVFRSNAISEAAHMEAREAVVHGTLASQPWTTNVTAQTNIQSNIQSFLNNAGVQTFQVAVIYLDGNNAAGSRVRVTVTSTFQPMTFIVPTSFNLTSTATMAITH